MLESLIKEESKESSWKDLRKNPFTVYLTFCTCIGLSFLGYYAGIIIHVLYMQHDYQSVLLEGFLGTGMIWVVFGAAIGCWANVGVSRAISIGDTLIFLGGGMIYADSSVAGKLFTGIGIGMVSMASPLFIWEASQHQTTRLLILRTHSLFFAVGMCLSFYLIYYGLTTTTQELERTTHMISLTRFPALLQLSLISLIGPESPVWIFIEKHSIDSPMLKRNDTKKSTAAAVCEKCSDRGTLTSRNSGKPDGTWTHMNRHYVGSDVFQRANDTCNCSDCGKRFNCPSAIGTSHSETHLRRRCTNYPFNKINEEQKITSLVSGAEVTASKFDIELRRKSLARMFILCELPFSLVERYAFVQYNQELNSEFNSSITTLTRDCMEIYSEERYKLEEILSSNRVCLTTDTWSSIKNLGYICLTAYYVDKDWNPQKKIINFSGLQYPPTVEVIAQTVERCLLSWGIKDVAAITLSNTKFDRQGLKCLMQSFSGLLSHGDFFHVACFAHIIKLVVTESINDVIHLIRRLRKHVKYITSSPSRSKIFKECAFTEGIITKKYLCLDVKTEWDTTYLMLGAAIKFSKAFERMADQDFSYKQEFESNGIGHMDDNYWKVIKSLHIFLEHFYLTTKRIFGSHSITLNVYFDELSTIKDRLLEHLANAEPFLLNMAIKMNQNFDKYCSIDEVNPIVVIAMVLDPRYKLHYVEFWYARYYEKTNYSLNKEQKEEKVSVFIESLKKLMSRLYLQYKMESSDCIVDICSISGNTVKSEFSEFLRTKGNGQALSDLERYLQDDVEPMTNDFHILSWWKEKVRTYHALAVMARDVLTIPVTSVAPDCAFSTAKRILDPFRSSLTPEMVECLICTKDWLADAGFNESNYMEEKN